MIRMNKRGVILLFIIFQLTYIKRTHQTLFEIVAEQQQREYNTPLLMTPCIRHLMLKYSNSSTGEGAMTLLSVLHQSAGAQRDLLRVLMENIDLNFMIKKSYRFHYSPHKVIEKSRMYTFLTLDSSDIEGVIALLRPLPTWNAMAKVLVIFPFEIKEDELTNQVQKSLRYLFEDIGFFDVIVIARKKDTMTVMAYSFFPYDDNNCAKGVNNIQVIDTCEIQPPDDLDLTDYKAVENFIHGKKRIMVTKELRDASGKVWEEIPGCAVRISVADFPPFSRVEPDGRVERGIEVNIMKTVVERKLKATIDWAVIAPKVRYSNFTVNNRSGIFADLINRKSSFVLGGFFRTAQMGRQLHITPPTIFDDITFCVHSADLAPAWLNTFKTFQWSLWLGIILTLFICGFIIFGFIRFEPDYKRQNYAWSLLTTFGFCIAMFTVKFEPQRVFIRIFVSTLLLLGINCYAAYTSSLISILTKPRLNDQVDTPQEILESKLLVYGSINHYNFLRDYKAGETVYREILKNYFVCETNLECFARFSNNSKSAIITSRKNALHNPAASHIKKFCFDDSNHLFAYSAAIISYPFNHLLPSVTDGIYRIVAGGLIMKWEQDIKPKGFSGDSTKHVKLSLRHLEGAFVLIGIGSALAIIAFVVEWVYFVHVNGREEAMERFYSIVKRDLKAVKIFVLHDVAGKFHLTVYN